MERDGIEVEGGQLNIRGRRSRWFGGKGRDWELTGVRRVGELPDAPDGLRVTIELAEVTYGGDAADTEREVAPLRQADGALVIDTGEHDVAAAVSIIRHRLGAKRA